MLKLFFLFTICVCLFGPSLMNFSYAIDWNLYVSASDAMNNLDNKFKSTQNSLKGESGCSSPYPDGYRHQSHGVYIDRIAPTFDSGYYKKEYPLVIGDTSFKTSEFGMSNPVIFDLNNSMSITLLMFENTGPHNVQNVTINFKIPKTIFQKDTFIRLSKDLPPPVTDPLYFAISSGISEDRHKSYLHPNKLGDYSLEVSDPQNIFSNVTGDVKKVNHKMQADFLVFFENSLDSVNIEILASDVDGNTMHCKVLDAIIVH